MKQNNMYIWNENKHNNMKDIRVCCVGRIEVESIVAMSIALYNMKEPSSKQLCI